VHTLVIGGGEVGRTIADRLSREGHDVTIVDVDPEKLRDIAEHLDVHTVLGNGSSPTILGEADIGSAEILLGVTDSDEVNLMACVMAGAVSPATVKIARVRDVDYLRHAQILDRIGIHIDLFINPERVVAERIQRILSVPGATDVSVFAEGRVLLVAFRMPPDHPATGQTLEAIDAAQGRPQVLAVALQRAGRLIVPRGADRLEADDIVYAVAPADGADALARFLGVKAKETRRVFIHGGGNISLLLARDLEAADVHVKIIERDARRCAYLSEQLARSVILQGDGADWELLEEENVAGADAYIALTADQERNILSALLAKRLGARTVHALIDRPGYSALATAIGVDVTVSPRLSAVSSILQYVRRGRILAATTFMDESAEAIEIQALETSSLVGRPLRDVKLPRGALVGAIVRGDDVEIPRGASVIRAGDRVILFALRESVRQVEKVVAVSLEYF
jgi:trk system potassium uptake protein